MENAHDGVYGGFGVDDRADPAIVRLDGEHDLSTRADVQLAFQRVRDNPRLIVDLSGLDYIDSTVIDVMFSAEARTVSLHGKMVIMARNQRLIRLLSIAGLTRRTPIVATLDAAINALRGA